MKKLSGLIMAIILSFQALIVPATTVLASETDNQLATSQKETSAKEKAKEKELESDRETSSETVIKEEHEPEMPLSPEPEVPVEVEPENPQPKPEPSPEPTPEPDIKPNPEPTPAPEVKPAPEPELTESETSVAEAPVTASGNPRQGAVSMTHNKTTAEFVKKMGEPARKIGQEQDLYASVMIAQAILESASGNSQLAQEPYYNFFGIKGSHNGNSVQFATQEDPGNGALFTTTASFKAYGGYEESLQDYANLLKEGVTGNPGFYEGVWKSNTETYKEATAFLTGRYATDTSYDQKLNALIQTYGLTSYDNAIGTAETGGFIMPVANYAISSPYGERHFNGRTEFHRGLDFASAANEPIKASKGGTILKAEFDSSWGNYVVIEHEDGMMSLYAHQSSSVVSVGEKVEQGQLIGYVGTTGDSTGNHLHLEIGTDSSLSRESLIDPSTVLGE